MKIFLIIAVVLLIGAFYIVYNENIRLNTWNGVVLFSNLYTNWLIDMFKEGKDITGSVVEFFNP